MHQTQEMHQNFHSLFEGLLVNQCTSKGILDGFIVDRVLYLTEIPHTFLQSGVRVTKAGGVQDLR